MKVVVAPEKYELQAGEVACFLAGGITNCPEWQTDVIKNFEAYDKQFKGELDHLVLFNPRRENFPIDDPNASEEQIAWEFKWLQQMDIFSMYFTAGPSDQPICLYELGRNLVRMEQKFPANFQDLVVISCDKGYKRFQDVKIQTSLAFAESEVKPDIIEEADPRKHMYHIIRALKAVEKMRSASY